MEKLRFVVNPRCWVVFVVAASMLVSCKQNTKQAASATPSTSAAKDTAHVTEKSPLSNEAKGNATVKEDFTIFELSNFEDSGDTMMLVSVSDVDTLSRDINPNVIPD